MVIETSSTALVPTLICVPGVGIARPRYPGVTGTPSTYVTASSARPPRIENASGPPLPLATMPGWRADDVVQAIDRQMLELFTLDPLGRGDFVARDQLILRSYYLYPA